jgi:Rrf2 family transcriptional regulator, cysteine metabolism repressor
VVLVGRGVDQGDRSGDQHRAADRTRQRPGPERGEKGVTPDVAQLAHGDVPPGELLVGVLSGEDEDQAHQGERGKCPQQWPAPSVHRGAARQGKRDVVISVTSKSRYAVVALAELARAGDTPMPIGQVAERRSIPVQFLEQLFSTLRRAGILVSHRGAKGGYTLARPPDQINVLEVVQALDGVVGQEGKEAGGIWEEGVEALRATFRSTSIADIARREAEEAGAGMYHI